MSVFKRNRGGDARADSSSGVQQEGHRVQADLQLVSDSLSFAEDPCLTDLPSFTQTVSARPVDPYYAHQSCHEASPCEAQSVVYPGISTTLLSGSSEGSTVQCPVDVYRGGLPFRIYIQTDRHGLFSFPETCICGAHIRIMDLSMLGLPHLSIAPLWNFRSGNSNFWTESLLSGNQFLPVKCPTCTTQYRISCI